jgi:hypothetical protein
MASWVVPTVAAELWGVSVEQIHADVEAGRVNARYEGEFLFVDVDPASSAAGDHDGSRSRTAASQYRRPLTWAITGAMPRDGEALVTAEERDALLEPTAGSADSDSDDAMMSDTCDIDAPPPQELTSDDTPDWEQVRARVARTRRPPMSQRYREAA